VTATLRSQEKSDRASNGRGALYLLGDMALVVNMTAIVKIMGGTFPAIQLVFLRAVVGLLLVAPLVWKFRHQMFDTRRLRGHLGRVLCNALALSCNFAAVTALPLAVVVAVGFTRPFIMLGLAGLMVGERIPPLAWAASAVCFAGVLLVADPASIPWDTGLLAAFGSVLFGGLATLQTRRLKGEHTVLLMLFYTLGLTVLTAVPAGLVWVTPTLEDLPALLAIGVLAQAGQFCFLRAYHLAEIRVLAPLGYLWIVISMGMDYLAFDIVPTWTAILGAAIIIAAAAATQFLEQKRGG
jgi:drug/metabolite transporter (DMT)-like permease